MHVLACQRASVWWQRVSRSVCVSGVCSRGTVQVKSVRVPMCVGVSVSRTSAQLGVRAWGLVQCTCVCVRERWQEAWV